MKFKKLLKADKNRFLIRWFVHTDDVGAQKEYNSMYANTIEEAKQIADENTWEDEFCKVIDTLTKKEVYDTWQDMMQMREDELEEDEDEEYEDEDY